MNRRSSSGNVSGGLRWPSWPVGLAALVGGLVVATGVYARVAGLGSRPLAVDEYYFLQSVASILEGGLPELPGGGLYVRGVLIQYLTAGAIRVTGDELVGLRLPSVVFGLLATVPTWILARQWTGRWGAFALSCVVLLSSWEIEFSRFGRMYAGFQLVSLVFLVIYTRAVRDGRSGALWALPPLCLAATLCHFSALFFLPLLFVPFVTAESPRRERPPPPYALTAAVVTTVSVGLERFDFRNLGQADRLPQDMEAGRALLRAPVSLITGEPVPGVALVLVVALAGLAAAVAWGRAAERQREPAALAAAALAFAVFHQLVPAAILAGLVVLRYRAGRIVRRTVLATAVVCLAWISALVVLAMLESSAVESIGTGSLPGAMRRTLLAWPDYYVAFVRVWMRDLPLLFLAMVLTGGWALVAAARLRTEVALTHPAVLALYFTTLFSVFAGPEETTRYLYFFYPVLLLVVLLGSEHVLGHVPRLRRRTGIAVGILLGVFLASRDFDPRHLGGVTSNEVAFRTGRFERMRLLWYPRRDYETPARFLNALRPEPGELIVAAHVPPVSYYLEREHVVYWSRRSDQFLDVSRERGTRYLWSGGPLVGTPVEIGRLAAGLRRIWIVERAYDIDLVEAFGPRPFDDEVVMTGRDGRVSVRRVDFLDEAGDRLDTVP